MKVKKFLAIMIAISMLFASTSFASETEFVSATELGRPIYTDGTIYEQFPHFEGQWIQDSIGWRFQKTDGNFVSGMVAWIKGRYYHFNATGYMDTGVVMTEDGYYKYFAPDGSQRFNQWVYWNGGYYYAGSSDYKIIGPVLTNRYVDGYWVGADGRWDGNQATTNSTSQGNTQQVNQSRTQSLPTNNEAQSTTDLETYTDSSQTITIDGLNLRTAWTHGGPAKVCTAVIENSTGKTIRIFSPFAKLTNPGYSNLKFNVRLFDSSSLNYPSYMDVPSNGTRTYIAFACMNGETGWFDTDSGMHFLIGCDGHIYLAHVYNGEYKLNLFDNGGRNILSLYGLSY